MKQLARVRALFCSLWAVIYFILLHLLVPKLHLLVPKLHLLVPKLQFGNVVLMEAPASLLTTGVDSMRTRYGALSLFECRGELLTGMPGVVTLCPRLCFEGMEAGASRISVFPSWSLGTRGKAGAWEQGWNKGGFFSLSPRSQTPSPRSQTPVWERSINGSSSFPP